ncbi:MAG TPA: hypothetical protein DCX53_05695 [Anaerolineae bacterium]|nr:hypothetical protein [Anaerolineae bacterium]
MLDRPSNKLAQAVMETLVYSDVFEFPLTAHEVHRFIIGSSASFEETLHILKTDTRFSQVDGYFTLAGREGIADIRKQREARSKKLLPYALKYGRMLGSLPFVRMVALTGSLAVMNVSKTADFDYMLVTTPGRVWTARAFALLLNRFTRLFGQTLCPNLIISETALEWPLHDLYSARELAQMIPITRMDVYQRLMKANEWAQEFLPNAFPSIRDVEKQSPALKRGLLRRSFHSFLAMTESILNGKFGDRFEVWEMTRKIARLSKQEGFGEETIFTAEVCQGNFHHHRKWTQKAFEEMLESLRSDSPLPIGEGAGVRVR